LDRTSKELTEKNRAGASTADEPAVPQTVFLDDDQPFEKPASEFVPGPFYKAADERIPEVAESSLDGVTAGSSDLAVDRRDFMRLFSASALFGASACIRRPEETAIPYVNQPIDQIPGVPTYYATTCGDCSAGCGVVIKTREGRPVKVEGSPEHPINQGSTCATGQATLQGLYHPERRKAPQVKIGERFHDAAWDETFDALASRVSAASKVAIFTGGSTGHRLEFYRKFLKHIGSSEDQLYVYEPNGLMSSISKAHEIAFGASGMPRADLRSAELIVGIGSDFLDIGTSSCFHTKGFSASHSFQRGKMGRFVQFESGMSQTGARSDDRYPIAPGDELGVALLLVKSLLANSSSKGSAGERSEMKRVLDSYKGYIVAAESRVGVSSAELDKVAADLITKKSVVMCGGTAIDENATMLQVAAIMANTLIGAYGKTLFFDRGWMTAPTTNRGIKEFIEEAGDIDLVIVIDSNPIFTVPQAFGIDKVFEKIPQVISIQNQNTETDRYATVRLPGHHYLESWGDEQPVAGFWTVRQPAVRALANSRQSEDILLWVAGAMKKPMGFADYRTYLMQRWKNIHKTLGNKVDFDTFWRAVLRRGFVGKLEKRNVRSFANVRGKIAPSDTPFKSGLKLVSPLDVRLQDGRGADKPVLQEAGDSMTTITWDSWVAINPNTAKKLGFRRNDLLKVEGSGGSVEVALYPMPGMHPDAVYIHRGNGHAEGVSRVTDGFGVNPLGIFSKSVDSQTGQPVTSGQTVKLIATGKRYRLAAMQKHNDIANRSDVIKKVTLASAVANAGKRKNLDDVPDLYPKLKESPDYRWGLSVDLTSCTGCSACMVACATENNIPQVGRQQILMGREMHWIRLDRYFAGDVDNPEVTYQPVMCQHCNHAPCEAVCPVYATAHDPEGMNGQTYNRCVGTRYCANACPYKVRRFNWFTHKWNVISKTKETNRNPRALNPDVTVRTRGVMEKCSFCVQRIRDAKHNAIERGEKVRDGEIRTACEQVCPANAITFGNLKDGRSRISRNRSDNRSFLMLNADASHGHYGIKTLPNVNYLAEVTHKESAINKKHHGGSSKPSGDHGAKKSSTDTGHQG